MIDKGSETYILGKITPDTTYLRDVSSIDYLLGTKTKELMHLLIGYLYQTVMKITILITIKGIVKYNT